MIKGMHAIQSRAVPGDNYSWYSRLMTAPNTTLANRAYSDMPSYLSCKRLYARVIWYRKVRVEALCDLKIYWFTLS